MDFGGGGECFVSFSWGCLGNGVRVFLNVPEIPEMVCDSVGVWMYEGVSVCGCVLARGLLEGRPYPPPPPPPYIESLLERTINSMQLWRGGVLDKIRVLAGVQSKMKNV